MQKTYLCLKDNPGGELVEQFAAELRETIEWTGDVEHATLFYPDYAEAIQSRIKKHEQIETELVELPRPCPNIALQAWKQTIDPVYESVDATVDKKP
jgi:hypothetical protein